MINPKYLIIVFLCGCSSPPDHTGVWLNNNLDYIEFSNDSFYFASTYSEHLFSSKYSLSNDTIKVNENFMICENESICELRLDNSRDIMRLDVIKSTEINGFRLIDNDSFYPENEKMIFFQYDSIVISQFLSKYDSTKLLSTVKITNNGIISLVFDKNKITINYKYWEKVNNEIGKIIGNQFKLWNEGDEEDGYFLKINIYRDDKIDHYSGSMIPYYFKHLNNLLNIAERKRINTIFNN